MLLAVVMCSSCLLLFVCLGVVVSCVVMLVGVCCFCVLLFCKFVNCRWRWLLFASFFLRVVVCCSLACELLHVVVRLLLLCVFVVVVVCQCVVLVFVVVEC